MDNRELLILGGSIVALVVVVLLWVLTKKKKKKPTAKTYTIDDAFIAKLLLALGSKENIDDIEVDHQRLKVTVKEVRKVELEVIKNLGAMGVIVAGRSVKALFKHESEELKRAIMQHIKGVHNGKTI